eukprot:1505640-Rhodomonas_salina.2
MSPSTILARLRASVHTGHGAFCAEAGSNSRLKAALSRVQVAVIQNQHCRMWVMTLEHSAASAVLQVQPLPGFSGSRFNGSSAPASGGPSWTPAL